MAKQFNSLRFATVALLFVLTTGCLATLVPPDFESFYDPVAAARYPDRNPVIVIPGFIGSRLTNTETGQVIWGDVGGDFADPGSPSGARSIALSMREEVQSPAVRPDVLESIRVQNVPLLLKPYVRTLRTLGSAGYRDEAVLQRSGKAASSHLTSFQFAFDWRLDNAANARRLHEFILEKAAYCRADRKRRGEEAREIRFDIIAHSMGAVLTRYYLRYGPQSLPGDGSLPELTWEGAKHVEKAILLAPPNAGSVKAALQMIHGVRHAPGLPHYDALLNGTFPSAYQLFPRARHGAVVDLRDPSKTVDLFDPELWERAGWGLAAPDRGELLAWLLPDVETPEERRRIALAYQKRMLRLAAQFQRAIDLPAEPPEGTGLFLVVGDSEPTDAVLAVDPDFSKAQVIARGDGDGSVLRSSALFDDRPLEPGAKTYATTSSIPWREILFTDRKHSRVTVDPVFSERVVQWLLGEEEGASAGPSEQKPAR